MSHDADQKTHIVYTSNDKSNLVQEVAGAALAAFAGFLDNQKSGFGEKFGERAQRLLNKVGLTAGSVGAYKSEHDENGNHVKFIDGYNVPVIGLAKHKDKYGEYKAPPKGDGAVKTENGSYANQVRKFNPLMKLKI